MNVLILHQHFNTPVKGGPLRSYYLAKALMDAGITPIVITIHNEKRYHKENVEGIEVHYLPIPYDNSFSFFKRSVSFLRYVTAVVRLSKQFRHVDLCYAISTPLTVGIAALYIKRQWKIPYVFDVGDLWPDAPIDLGYIKNLMLKKSLYDLERKIYRKATSIIALSPAIKHAIEKKISDKSIYLIPNMADTEFYHPVEKNPALASKFNVERKFVVAYTGAIGVANGLDHVLLCAKEAQEENLPIHILICGEGAMKTLLMEKASEMKLANISFIPFQHRKGVREVVDVSDAMMISYKPEAILETGSPNKYFDGLAAGKLIIINFSGWIRDEIESQRCGIFVDQQKRGEFSLQLRKFLDDALLLKQYQASARALAETKYSRKNLSTEFALIIREAVAQTTR